MNAEIGIMTASLILALIAILVALGSTYSAYMYRQSTEREVGELRTKIARMESTLLHYETQNTILTRENHELLQKLVDKK